MNKNRLLTFSIPVTDSPSYLEQLLPLSVLTIFIPKNGSQNGGAINMIYTVASKSHSQEQIFHNNKKDLSSLPENQQRYKN